MEHTENLTNHAICQCKNSIKLRALELININDKPILMENLIQIIFEKVKSENRHIIIDDNFLKTYIRSIISEMVDSKLIAINSIENKKDDDVLYYVKLDSEKLSNFLLNPTSNSSLNLNSNSSFNSALNLNSNNISASNSKNISETNNANYKDKDKDKPLDILKSASDKKSITSEEEILNNSNTSYKSNKNINNALNEVKQNQIKNIENSNNSIKSDKTDNADIKLKLVDELISLRNKLDKIKKENKNTKLHNEIHRYNEIKDVGQELLGYIASNKGKLIKELYEDIGISDDEDK